MTGVPAPRAGRTHKVFTEGRLGTDSTGRPAAIDVASGPAAWRYYLVGGDRVSVAARRDPRPGSGLVSFPPEISVDALPYYVGPGQFLRRLPTTVRAIHRALDDADSIVLRVPGPISSIAGLLCIARRRSYSVDVVGDLGDILRCGVMGSIGKLLHPVGTAHVKWLVKHAAASRYVTAQGLQQRYPPRPGTPTVGVSDVCLGADGLVAAPRRFPSGTHRLIAVGTLETVYKGHDLLIEAVRLLAHQGLDVSATVVGGGRLRDSYERLARERGVAERVSFVGVVADRAELIRLLDAATIFLMPSRQEGLPRALVEAMARALPAVGSRVGGIPELLDPSCIVEVDDAVALAAAVRRLATDAEHWERQSALNLTRAREFDPQTLQVRFSAWLAHVPAPRRAQTRRPIAG